MFCLLFFYLSMFYSCNIMFNYNDLVHYGSHKIKLLDHILICFLIFMSSRGQVDTSAARSVGKVVSSEGIKCTIGYMDESLGSRKKD